MRVNNDMTKIVGKRYMIMSTLGLRLFALRWAASNSEKLPFITAKREHDKFS